jgi:hypothetical protein
MPRSSLEMVKLQIRAKLGLSLRRLRGGGLHGGDAFLHLAR